MSSFVPRMSDKIISVDREMRCPKHEPEGSILQAKKPMKLKGVIDRSLQFRIVRTRSSILLMVLGLNTYLAPLTCTRLFSFISLRLTTPTTDSCQYLVHRWESLNTQ